MEEYNSSHIIEVITEIERINYRIYKVFNKSYGWAPQDAAEMLERAHLDWQYSLSKSLRNWIVEPDNKKHYPWEKYRKETYSINDGDLILAWVNIGSLVETTIKTFLCIHYNDYKKDLETLKNTRAWHGKKKKLLPSETLYFDVVIDYCERAKIFSEKELVFFKRVQENRNSIHIFGSDGIESIENYYECLEIYLEFLQSVEARIPFP